VKNKGKVETNGLANETEEPARNKKAK